METLDLRLGDLETSVLGLYACGYCSLSPEQDSELYESMWWKGWCLEKHLVYDANERDLW